MRRMEYASRDVFFRIVSGFDQKYQENILQKLISTDA
jgi:hypothetical protein